MEYVYQFLKKKRKLFTDNRLFVFLCVTAFTLLGFPGAVEYTTELEAETQGLIVAITQAVEIVLGMVALLYSHGVRKPSGQQSDAAEQLVDKAREAGMDV